MSNTPESDILAEKASLLRLAANASILTAILLVAVKFAAWLLTGSLSVLASLVDSLMDAAASLVNLVGIRYSLKSADEDHTFGHGKAEYLTSLAQASFIVGSAIFLILQAIERLSHPRDLTKPGVGIGVMIFAIVATLLLLWVQRYVIKKTNSTAIRADSLHYFTDLLTNLSTILALFLASRGLFLFDSLIALGIAAFIIFSASKIAYDATQMLMDRQLPVENRESICAIALAHDQVLGVHGLRTMQSGQTSLIQLHLELDRQVLLSRAHAVAKEVELQIRESFPGADIIIHQDPVSPAEKSKSVEHCLE